MPDQPNFLKDILDAQEKLQTATDAVRGAKLELDYREAQLTLDVLDARDPATGKSLYTNDTARAAALTITKHTDPVYQDKLKSLIAQERLKTLQAARVEQAQNAFKLHRLDREMEIALAYAART